MRRALLVVLAVLVLGAWTCAPVDDGGEPMAGPTTSGLAALIEGEGWHYVGETDEPAFQNSWGNAGSGAPKAAFRIRESGVVDLYLGVSGGSLGTVVFTLPTGYRPSLVTIASGWDFSLGGTENWAGVAVNADGEVVVDGPSGATIVQFAGYFWLDPPESAA